MKRILTTLIIVAILFAQNVFASSLGVLYEQIYDPTNSTIPTVSVSGNSSISNSQTLALSASATACSTCTPFYYWEANGGTFQGTPNSPNVTWVPPSTNTAQPYNITCTVGDGKGSVASSILTVNVTSTSSSCTSTVSTPTLFDPGLWSESSTVYISWQTVNNAIGYIFQESTSPSFSSYNQYPYDQNTLNAVLSDRTNGTYYYRVKAQNACGSSSWSNTVDLEVRANQPPNTPSSPTPSMSATNVSRTPHLLWTGGDADGTADYAIEIGTDPNNMWFIQSYNSVNKYNNSFQVSWSLNASTKYYWRVRSIDDKGAITIGPTWSFTTSNQSADLVATDINVVGTIANDQMVAVNVTVQNQGSFLADGGIINYYYSIYENGKDQEFTYAFRGVPQLNPGESAVVSTNIRIAGLQQGLSYLVADVVPFIQVLESDRSNNTISFPINYVDTVGPNISFFALQGSSNNQFKTFNQYNIAYTALDDIGVSGVDLSYSSDNGTTWNNIVTSFPVTGNGSGNSYSWSVPGTVPANNTFLLKITAFDPSGNSSSKTIGPFTIIDGSTPSVSFTSPVGGEVWPLGSTKSITWNASSPNGIKSVYLSYWYSSNQADSIVTLQGNPGSYSWTLPSNSTYASTAARISIQITDNNYNVITLKSSPFTVTDASAPPPLPWATQNQITTVPVIGTQFTSQDDAFGATTVDKYGNVHVAYVYTEDNMSYYMNDNSAYPGRVITYKLMYMKKTGSSWSAPTVVKTIVNNQDRMGIGTQRVFYRTSIVTDNNANPHLAWQEVLSYNVADIYHSYYNGSSWSTPENISNDANVGKFSWSNLTAPPDTFDSVKMVSTSSDIYASGFSYYKRLYKYNLSSGNWTQLADVPGSITWNGISGGDMSLAGSLIYAVDSTGTFVAYNPSTNIWTQKASLLQSGNGVRLAAIGTKIYAFGAGSTNKLQVYDTGTNTWSYLATAPTARGYAAIAVLNNKLLVIGGEYSGTYYQITEEYDPSLNAWRNLNADTSGLRGRMGGAEVLNGRIYLTLPGYASIEMYEPNMNLWTPVDQMSAPYTMGDITVINGKLYVLGSNDGYNMHLISGALNGSDTTTPKYPNRPLLTADLDNNVTIYWVDGIYLTRNGSVGTSSIYSKKFTTSNSTYSTASILAPAVEYAVTFRGNTIDMVYQNFAADQYSYISSKDAGSTWAQAISVPNAGTYPQYSAFKIASDSSGNVHFVGGVNVVNYNHNLIYMTLIGDGKFQKQNVATKNTGNAFEYFNVKVDSLDAPVVTYQNNWSIYFTKQLSGSSWSDPIAGLPASQSATGQFGSTVDLAANKLHLIYNSPKAGHSELFYNTADLSGDLMPPSATLTGPFAGAVVQGGSTVSFFWTATDDKGISSVMLKYTIDGGTTFTTIATGLATTGSYLWVVPNISTTTMQVYLVATDTASKQTVSQSNIFTVNFIQSYSLSINKNGTGTGIVSSNPAGISCGTTCSSNYMANTSVSLTAMPTDGNRFTGWSGACQGTGSCNILIDSVKSVTAGFELVPVEGTCGSSDGKSLATMPTTGLCTYGGGTPTSVVGAGPWNWICQGSNGGGSVMCSANKFVQLTLIVGGNGYGTLTSVPSSISCTSGTCQAAFDAGTAVEILVTPNALTSVFAGWTGACTGKGTCNTIMDIPKSITAIFNLTPKIKLDVLSSTGFETLAVAYLNASDKIYALQSEFSENWTLGDSKNITLKGGYLADFGPTRDGFTILNGKLTIGAGSLTVEKLVIR